MEQEKVKTISNENAEFLKFLMEVASYAHGTPQNSSEVKKCIASFSAIFAQCENKDGLKKYIGKACGLITRMYSKLSEYFYQCEPQYLYEFYYHWYEILSCIKWSTIAKYCERSIPQITISVGHLRAVGNRMEQVPILNVLLLYTQHVRPDALKADAMDNKFIIEIAMIAKKKSHKLVHNFLNCFNVDGENIFTMRPIQATPAADLDFPCAGQKQDIWLDFSSKDQSIVFVINALNTDKLLCYGIVQSSIVQHYTLRDRHHLLCSGLWTIFNGSDLKQSPTISKIMFTCSGDDRMKIDFLKSRFNITEYQKYATTEIDRDKDDDLGTVGETSTISFGDSVIATPSATKSEYDTSTSGSLVVNNDTDYGNVATENVAEWVDEVKEVNVGSQGQVVGGRIITRHRSVLIAKEKGQTRKARNALKCVDCGSRNIRKSKTRMDEKKNRQPPFKIERKFKNVES